MDYGSRVRVARKRVLVNLSSKTLVRKIETAYCVDEVCAHKDLITN